MELSYFDIEKAKMEARTFLSKSIYTFSVLLNLDLDSLDENSKNPFDPNSFEHESFKCLMQEIIAYKKLG